MKIQDMFEKDITRKLEGVIVVSENDERMVKQELDEYVVTRDTAKHFETFFNNYKDGIRGATTGMGVWISGFFGSGKSHFLKMLAYILENRVVDGKNALQYLKDNNQINDGFTLANMELAAETPTDVILFNIDAKSGQSGKQGKDSITSVFLRVFNEMQGFCGSMPYVADLERNLVSDGRYDEFKNLFYKTSGEPWEESRDEFDFIQDTVVDVLAEMDYMSVEASRNWCEKANEPYAITPEDFAKRVEKYIETKGHNHHVVFMVDEVGQYIGDNSNMMLTLQTITEQLGSVCKGKAWVIVTSQEDIDSVVKTKGNDFSKIQGRFPTRVSLTSADVSEVIKKRILCKTPTAEDTLSALYEQSETKISNLITFKDTPEMKLYENENDFVEVYPFVPYQFKLLGDTLTSIRTHGASGKHLSEGARSMLALFKESAEAIKDENEGALVPYYRFYDALENFLDSSHRSVIQYALDNKKINPDGKRDCFAVNVLKCLFLIKYVKEMENATIENITTLMISNINGERGELSEKVESALNLLIGETLVQKCGNNYTFLSQEEQEIEREIRDIPVEPGEVQAKISELFYDDIYGEKSYKYDKDNGKYTFPFNRITDEIYYKNIQGNEIGIHLITPCIKADYDELTFRMMSQSSNEVVIALPDDNLYWDEITNSIKIDKYLHKSSSSVIKKYDDIKSKKSKEMMADLDNAKGHLTDCLKRADIYVNGNKQQSSSYDVKTRINEALSSLVSAVYSKLSYIEHSFTVDDIRKLLSKTQVITIDLNGVAEPNADAQTEVLKYIKGNSDKHTKTSMKSLKDKFMKAPYGFVDDDVQWIVANLYKKSDISLYLNGKQILISDVPTDDLVKYITKKDYADKLMTDFREKASESNKQIAIKTMKDVFGFSCSLDNEDEIWAAFKKQSENKAGELGRRLKYDYKDVEYDYPGRKVVKEGLDILNSVNAVSTASDFYTKIAECSDDLIKCMEDYEPVVIFFNGKQKDIFKDSVSLLQIYDDSKSYISDENIETCAASIKAIIKSEKPYKDIHNLPELNKKFRDAYNVVLDEHEKPVVKTIESDRQYVIDRLKGEPFADKFNEDIGQFDEFLDDARKCNNITTLESYAGKADALRENLRKKIDKLEEIPGDQVKTLHIRDLTGGTSWHIETESDIDKHIGELRKRIEREIEDGSAVDIKF